MLICHVPCVAIGLRKVSLVRVYLAHVTACYEDNAATDDEDRTNDVEDRSADAAGGGKFCAGIIDDGDRVKAMGNRRCRCCCCV